MLYTSVFKERLEEMIDDVDLFYSAQMDWKSIRVNSLKIDKDNLYDHLCQRFVLKSIPWYNNGFFIKGEIAKTLEHYLGYYHIQGASSLVPPIALDPKPAGEILYRMQKSE